MHHLKPSYLLPLGSLLLVLGIGLWLAPAQPVQAQCGSQASSCKNCHEVQGQDPVNNDGTGWHESHAFGDFCYICHAGNQQATDADAAHTGMVPPLSDIKASCQVCHTNDLEERAKVYETILGVETGTGAAAPAETNAATPEPQSESTAAPVESTAVPAAAVPVSDNTTVCPTGDKQLAVDDPSLVNYVQRYDEIVLGERPVNWGNMTLVGLIGLVAVGGGGFVFFNEMRLRRSSTETRKVEGEYPADVVDMLPAITALKSETRQSLKRILENPSKTDKVIGLLDAVVEDDKPEE